MTHNCCTKSRKSCCNKNNSEEVEADMEDSQAVVVMEDMESHHHTAHLKSHPNMAHPDTARDALLELNSDMLFRDTKSLNT